MWGEFPSGETRHLELSASVLTQDTTGESAGGAGGRPQVPLRFRCRLRAGVSCAETSSGGAVLAAHPGFRVYFLCCHSN